MALQLARSKARLPVTACFTALPRGYRVTVQRSSGQGPEVLTVAIVGMGPRGLSVLERLLITLSRRPVVGPVVIWAVDPVEHGPGRVWRTDQPSWLTMNGTAGEVTVRSPDNTLLAPGTSSSFAGWTQRGPGPELRSADYPERRHYGRYLRAVFDQLSARAPAGVEVRPVRGAATALHRVDGGRWLIVDHGRERLRVDKVVLATGHAELMAPEAEDALREHADRCCGLRYIGQGLTTEMPLAAIRPGSAVAVRGLGLTFYDVVRSLTLGRDGRFQRSADGALRYVPSGDEPVLYAGSRGGLPFLARARVAQPPQVAPSPVALTAERLAVMRAAALAARGSGQLDFAVEVEPVLRLEMQHAYYSCAARLLGGPRAARRFAAAHRGLIDRGLPVHAGAVGDLLAAHGLNRLPGVDFDALARPFDATTFVGSAHFRRRLVQALAHDVAESRKDTTASPLKAALEALRALRPALPSVVDFGGLLPDSHRDFLTRWAPMSFVLSAGPPAEQVEQVVALMAAGVLEVVGPHARFSADRAGRCFAVESPVVPNSRRVAHVLLDARVPTTDLRRDRAPLVRQLLAEGVISEYVNVGPGDQAPFATGGLAVTPTPSRVLDAAGQPDRDVYAIGVATEHTRWFTQVGTGRPGRDSPFCRDADGIARDVLAATT
jgi:FAD-NAD(P)-binding